MPILSRNINVAELRTLLISCPLTMEAAEYRSAVLKHNVLWKRTEPAQLSSWNSLQDYYGLDPSHQTFRVFRHL